MSSCSFDKKMYLLLGILAIAPSAWGHCPGGNCVNVGQGLMHWLQAPAPRPEIDFIALVQSGSDLYKEKQVSRDCISALEQCAANTMTTGRCKSTFGAAQLDWCRNDVNVDCRANKIDFEDDLDMFYDPNRDEQTCRNEWSDRRTSYFGYTRSYTDAEWEIITGSAEACFTKASLDTFPDYPLKSSFASNGVSRMVAFCNRGDNMRTNRVCMGLPVICRDRRPDLEACRGFTGQSLKDKLDKNLRANDPNGDGFSSAIEVSTDISTHYDLNNDGCATVDEWVARWTSYYGFTEEFGRAFFLAVNSDNDNCANINDVNRNIGNGTDSSFFPNTLMAILIGMCEANPSLYETNPDCAMVVDTCYYYFPENPACQVFVSQCGAKSYQTCVQLLPLRGQCTEGKDRQEVTLESLRIENQITPGCRDHVAACKEEAAKKEHVMRILGMH